MRTTPPHAWRKISCRETHRRAEWRRSSTGLRAAILLAALVIPATLAAWALAAADLGPDLRPWAQVASYSAMLGTTWWIGAATMRHQLAGAVVAAAIAAAAAIVAAAPRAVTDRLAALVRAAAERAVRLARAPQDACRASIGVAITSLLPRRSNTIGAAA